MKTTTIKQLEKIADCIYQVPYDELTDYLKGIRDMINLVNGEEQDGKQLSETVYNAAHEIYDELCEEEIPF